MYFYVEDKMTKTEIMFAYYRKFNALYGYFCNKYTMDNPGRTIVNFEDLEELYRLCQMILKQEKHPSECLPIMFGPFFGSYDYGDIYQSYILQLHYDLIRLMEIDLLKYNIYFYADY